VGIGLLHFQEVDLIGILNGQNDMIIKSLMKVIIGKKNIIATINFQSMQNLIGLNIGVQWACSSGVKISIPLLVLASRLLHRASNVFSKDKAILR
jgi:hypothetical protein